MAVVRFIRTEQRVPVFKNRHSNMSFFFDVGKLPFGQLNAGRHSVRVMGCVPLCAKAWVGVRNFFQGHVQPVQHLLVPDVGYKVKRLRIIGCRHTELVSSLRTVALKKIHFTVFQPGIQIAVCKAFTAIVF